MNSKERMMTALARGKPDRLPVTVHQWQKYHLDKYLAGISDLEAYQKFGMDAAVQFFQGFGWFWLQEGKLARLGTREWDYDMKIVSFDPENLIVNHIIRTPERDLTFQSASNPQTTWVTEYLIKQDEDIELLRKYMPVPALDVNLANKLYDWLGDRGIMRGFVWGDQAGCWQHACCLMDVNRLILRCFDTPDWVHEFLGILLEKKLRFIATMKGAKFDLIETGGGAASSTLISPAIHAEFCTPYDRKMHDALHEMGCKISYHTCGGTRGIEELIVKNGTDASETLAPPSIGGNQEPWEMKAKVGNRLALIGGMDQGSVLSEGTPEQIRAKVHELFERVGREGGYILSTADHFFETPLENLKAFAEAAKECSY